MSYWDKIILGDYKINSPNNPKTVIGTSPNTSYWEGIIGRLMEMLLPLAPFRNTAEEVLPSRIETQALHFAPKLN